LVAVIPGRRTAPGPETKAAAYGFRARAFGTPRNDRRTMKGWRNAPALIALYDCASARTAANKPVI
jgi:hypothetical protein